jgi:hypothetical protein
MAEVRFLCNVHGFSELVLACKKKKNKNSEIFKSLNTVSDASDSGESGRSRPVLR